MQPSPKIFHNLVSIAHRPDRTAHNPNRNGMKWLRPRALRDLRAKGPNAASCDGWFRTFIDSYGSGYRHNSPTTAMDPGHGELGSEKENHRRVIDPDQDQYECRGRAIGTGVLTTEVEAYEKFPALEEHRRQRRAQERITPSNSSIREPFQHRGKDGRDDQQRHGEVSGQ